MSHLYKLSHVTVTASLHHLVAHVRRREETQLTLWPAWDSTSEARPTPQTQQLEGGAQEEGGAGSESC